MTQEVVINNDISEIKSQEKRRTTYNYDEAVDLAGNGLYNRMVLFTSSVCCIGVALDMFSFGIIVEAAACDLALTMQQRALLSSAPFAGVMFAFFWGHYADTRGRRRALIWSTSGGFLFGLLLSFSSQWYMVLLCKFVGCSFSTAAFGLAMPYLGESTGSKHGSKYLQIMNSVYLFADTISFVLAYLILNLGFSVPMPVLGFNFRPWRLLNLSFIIFHGIGAFMLFFLHESPKFLASSGQVEEALCVLRKIYRTNGGRAEDYEVHSIGLPEVDVKKNKENGLIIMLKSVATLFKRPLLGRTLLTFYLLVVIASTNNSFSVWFPSIVNNFFQNLEATSGEVQTFCERINVDSSVTVSRMASPLLSFYSSAPYDFTEKQENICNDTVINYTLFAGMVFGLYFTFCNLIVSRLARFRRIVLICTLLISAASCILVDLVHNPVANLIFFALVQMTSICIGVAGSYIVDLFPVSHRALASSLGMMFARFGSFLGVNLIAYVIADACRAAFMGWSVFVLSGVLVAVLFLPTDVQIHRMMKQNSSK